MLREKIKLGINPDLIKYLEDNQINKEEGILYCIADYFEIPITSAMFPHLGSLFFQIPKEYSENVIIFTEDDSEKMKLLKLWAKLNYMPLFTEATANTKVPRRHSLNEVTKRLERLFHYHPEITKEDVIKAAKLHISETNPDYVLTAQYFISKGVGVERSEPILDYIDKLKELEEKEQSRNSISNTMQ